MIRARPVKAGTEDEYLASAQAIRIGCAGWNIPRGTAEQFLLPGTHLERYSRVLNCCEINSSFYRPHKDETWERWAGSVPAEFRFSVKAPKTITHEARLKCGPKPLAAFLRQVGFLGTKLGPILIQLPPSLAFEFDIANRFFSLLREQYSGDIVWEPRHGTWFDAKAEGLLKEFQISRVAADPACVPVAAHPGGFVNVTYFRLHGSPRLYYSAYSAGFLAAMAAQLERLSTKARVWCVFDNTASGFAAQNALELEARLKSLRAGVEGA